MYRVWIQAFEDGKHVMSMVLAKRYIRKGNAINAAEVFCQDHDGITYKYWVSEENPWREE